MKRSLQRLALAAVLCSLPSEALAEPGGADDDGADDDGAGAELDATGLKLFREASEAFDAKDYAKCYARARAADAVRKHYKIAAIRGDCALGVGKYVEAAFYLQLAVSAPRFDTMEPVIRTRVKERLGEARGRVAALRVTASAPEARLYVNGEPPELVNGELFVLPGEHTLRAEAPGRAPVEQKERVQAGKSYVFELVFPPPERGGPPKPQPIEGPEAEPSVHVAWPIATGVLGISALAAGIGLRVAASASADDALSFGEGLGGQACTGSNRPSNLASCEAIDDVISEHDTLRGAGLGLLIAGGALTAASAVLFFFYATDSRPPDKRSSIRVLPALSPQSGGLWLQGRF